MSADSLMLYVLVLAIGQRTHRGQLQTTGAPCMHASRDGPCIHLVFPSTTDTRKPKLLRGLHCFHSIVMLLPADSLRDMRRQAAVIRLAS